MIYIVTLDIDSKIDVFIDILKLSSTHVRILTVKPVLSGHSKIVKSKVLKTDGSLMQVESIAID